MAGAIKSLIKGRLPGAPGRRRQNVPLTLVHTSSARAAPAVRTLLGPALGDARILPAMPRLP